MAKVTRDSIIAAYRGLLLREPESEDVIKRHMDANDDLASFLRIVTSSEEYGVVNKNLSQTLYREGLLKGWAMSQIAPWFLKAVDGKLADKYFMDLQERYGWVSIFHFRNGEVTRAPHPTGRAEHFSQPERSALYLKFFQELVKTMPSDFSTTICVSTEDELKIEPEFPVFALQKRSASKALLLPDFEFFSFDYFEDPVWHDTISYQNKRRGAVFAGSTTGGIITEEIATGLKLPRLRAADYFRGSRTVDFRLPNICQVTSEKAHEILSAMPACRKPALEWKDQFETRLLLSMDGNGATCSRVVIALMSNSALIKYHSDNMLYYFAGMQPWVHYIPVAEDKEVEAIVEMEARYPELFETVALNGRQFAAAYLNRGAVMEYARQLLLQYAECMTAGAASVPVGAPAIPTVHAIAHVARVGDAPADQNGWIGRLGSGNAIEGFQLSVQGDEAFGDLTYQTLNAGGRLTAPVAAGQYCGTRGKSMPIHGFRLIVPPALAKTYEITYESRFTDGSRMGPVSPPVISSASSMAPLEAFRITLRRASPSA